MKMAHVGKSHPNLKVRTELSPSSSSEEDEETPKAKRRCGNNMSKAVSMERIRDETRLVVLDFLSKQPVEKLTARNLSQTENRPEILRKAIRRVSKSASDASRHEHRRKRFQNMALPLRRKLSLNLKRDIESFDTVRKLRHIRADLRVKPLEDEVLLEETKEEAVSARPNNLQLPKEPVDATYALPSPVLSPESKVAEKLESIGFEIMEMYPNLLDEPLQLICDKSDDLTYEEFKKAAYKVTINKKIVGWSKVALLCYFAREIALFGELDDKQLDLLAGYCFRFIEETTAEFIERQGGWAALELEDIPNPQDLVVKYREKERDSPDGVRRRSLRHSDGANYDNSWQSWAVKYGIAAIAVGVGVMLIKH